MRDYNNESDLKFIKSKFSDFMGDRFELNFYKSLKASLRIHIIDDKGDIYMCDFFLYSDKCEIRKLDIPEICRGKGFITGILEYLKCKEYNITIGSVINARFKTKLKHLGFIEELEGSILPEYPNMFYIKDIN